MNESLTLFHWTNLLIIPGLLVGYTVHELAHAFSAYALGDTSQVERGKITLNPFRHISWFGTFAFLLIGIGWPNPVEINPQTFKDRPAALGIVALAGPFASFTFSLAAMLFTLLLGSSLVYASGTSSDTILQFFFPPTVPRFTEFNLQALTVAFTSKVALASFWLAFTSMVPLPRMDGYLALVSLAEFSRRRHVAKSSPVQQARQVLAPQQPPLPPTKPINQYKRRNNVSDIHFTTGTEYHLQNKFDDAIARYRQALANDKKFGPAYVNLGLAYLGKGRRREAIHAFRGAIQFADDQKSQQEAWYQLHQLSEVSPVAEDSNENLTELGAAPWTDTKPRPNWLALSLGSALLLVGGIAFYSYLFSGLLRLLQA